MLHKAELVGFAEGVKYDYYISLVDTGEKCQISKALNAEIRINGIRVATIGEYDRQLTPMDMYVFNTGRSTHWEGFGVDFREDEDVEEVTFETFSIEISEEELAGDVLEN